MKIRLAVLELLHVDRQSDRQTDRHGALLHLLISNAPNTEVNRQEINN
jgi:hypothetical protein